MVTQDALKSVLLYLPETGQFYWLKRRHGTRIDLKAGNLDKTTGYIRIHIDGRRYYGHTLAWFYMTGVWSEVDHRNWIRSDNRFENLRACTRSQNHRNRIPKEGRVAGVNRLKNGRWIAKLHFKRKVMHLGIFSTKEAAIRQRELFAKKYYEGFEPPPSSLDKVS